MKKTCLVCLVIVFLSVSVEARDFMVGFVHENYKEVQAQFSYFPLVYHSIQINSTAGPKLIILKGDDSNYRRWIRNYIAENKNFILRIDDQNNDAFISSKAYELDINSIHPVNLERWEDPDISAKQGDTLSGNNYILVVDPDEKRSGLIKTIAERMGFQVLISSSGKQALLPFKLQPDKFQMVIAHHLGIGKQTENLLDQLLKVDHSIPVIVDTGYKNDLLKNAYVNKYRRFPSVIVKPVILQELSKIIEQIISGNV